MDALSRPPRRRDTTSSAPLPRKLSSAHSLSATAKHAYDGVFAAPTRAPSSRPSGIDDYGEIFGGSRASSIPVLDLPSLDESEVLASRRSSKLDYSNIFGGFRNDDAAVSYEELFEKPSGAKNSPEEARAATKGALSSSPPEQLDKKKMSKENQQGPIEEASSEPVDGLKQFNMSYHKTSQRDIEIKNGTTHIAQMHSTPGYTCFIDEGSSPLKKTVSGEYPKNSQSQPVQSKVASPLSNLGANLVDKRRQHKRSVTADFKEVPKRNTSKDGFTDYSSSLSDDEEVDLSAAAAASVAALKKALETAQASIRIAKEIMERRGGGTQRFEVKKKRGEKIPSGGNTKSLGNISTDSVKSGDVSEKDKAKLDNENYKLGSARKHEPASLNNQEADKRTKDRRTKEIPTTDDILELPNRATDVSEKDNVKLDSQNNKLGSARKHETLSLNNQDIDRRMKEILTTVDVLELPNRATDVSGKGKAKLDNQTYKLGSATKHEAVSLYNQETGRRTKEIPTIDDILKLPGRATDVSEKDKAKLDNESYKLGLARNLEAVSLNNQETDRRTKEIPTTDDILELPKGNKNSLEEACKVAEVTNTPQDAINEHYKSLDDMLELPNRNKNSLEEACKVAEVRNTLQDAVIIHYKSDDYIDNRSVAATHKTHELEDENKVGIYLNDEKLKEEHKLEPEESDKRRVCELEIARQLPDASNSTDNKSVASYKVHEEGETNKAEVSQDDIKMHKQEATPEKSEPDINLCLPTEESDKTRVCEEEVTKWGPNGSEDYSIGSSLIATYEVHEMERVSLNEEKMEDKQEASFRTGRCEAEINACLLLSEENDERRITQATDKTEKNERLPSEEAGCEKICVDPPQSEEMNNMAVPQADKECEENKKDFSRQEEYKESAEIEESEEFTDEEVKPASNQMPKEVFKESVEIDESEVFTGEEVKPASNQIPKEILTPEILKKENIAVDSKDGIDDEELHESRLKATCELKGVWKNRYLSSWWGAISDSINTKGSNDNERDNNNEHESKSTGADALKGVWKSRYLASEWGVNKEASDVESKEKENNEIENGLENKLKGTKCELKGVWKTRYLASDWGAIKESSVKEAEEVCQEDSLSDESERKGDSKNNQNQLQKEYDAEESDTSVGDESDDVDESESLFPKIHKFKETEIRRGDADQKVSTETETLDNALDASNNHLKAFQDETSSGENGSVSNVAKEFVDQDNLEAAAKMEDRVNEKYGCEEAEVQRKMNDGPPKDGFDDKQEESDFSSSSRDDKSYESFSEDKEMGPKIEESQKLLGIDGNKTKHGDEAKEVKQGKEEHVRRTAEMDQKTRERIVVERAIREARERAFTEARERAERAAVERATAEVRQRAMAEAREKIEKASAASSKSSTSKASVEARLRAERAAVERATSEARERAREKVALSQKANSSREPAANNDQQGSDGNNGESAQRRKARQERHQRTMERAAKALAEKNQRDLKSQKEQAERNRFAETLDAEVKRWSSGKEGNLRALLSTLQYILGPDSGWQPVQLTEIISIAAVKKTYRRANLHVHPDKLQQRGASIQQKYICEKVFDLLKAAWNKFNSEER